MSLICLMHLYAQLKIIFMRFHACLDYTQMSLTITTLDYIEFGQMYIFLNFRCFFCKALVFKSQANTPFLFSFVFFFFFPFAHAIKPLKPIERECILIIKRFIYAPKVMIKLVQCVLFMVACQMSWTCLSSMCCPPPHARYKPLLHAFILDRPLLFHVVSIRWCMTVHQNHV